MSWPVAVGIIAVLAVQGCAGATDCAGASCCEATGPRIDWALSDEAAGPHKVEVVSHMEWGSVAYRCDLGWHCSSGSVARDGGTNDAGAGASHAAGAGGTSGVGSAPSIAGAGGAPVSPLCEWNVGDGGQTSDGDWCAADPVMGACLYGLATISCDHFSELGRHPSRVAVRIWQDEELVADQMLTPEYSTIHCHTDCSEQECEVAAPITLEAL